MLPRHILVLGVLLLAAGPASPVPAHAEPVPASAPARADGGVELVKGNGESASSVRSSKGDGKKADYQLLKGELAWVVGGAAGALVPLVFLALPLIWFPYFGPGVWLPAIVVTLVWGTLMVAAGGGVAWLIQALLGDKRSGWLIPVAAAAAVGFGGILATALVSAVIFVPLFIAGAFWTGDVHRARPDYLYYGWYWTPFGALGAVATFCIWTVGLLATSIAGPMLAAFLYARLGEPRQGHEIYLMPTTKASLDQDVAVLQEDVEAAGSGKASGSSGGSKGGSKAGKGSSDGGGKGKSKGRAAGGSKSKKASPREVGGACARAADCAEKCVAGERFGDGMCSMSCGLDKGCPGGTQCVDSHGGICALDCGLGQTCPDGMQCVAMTAPDGLDVQVCVSK